MLVAISLTATSAIAADDTTNIAKNTTDLTTEKFFARPITELEIILINLRMRSEDIADFISEDRKLHIDRSVMKPEGDVGFDPESGRIYLALKLTVTEMADPWKEVCESTLKSFYGLFYFPESNLDENTRIASMERYFGEAVRIDRRDTEGAVDKFLSSLVVRATFLVGDSGKLKWLRECIEDKLDKKMYYQEHRYN